MDTSDASFSKCFLSRDQFKVHFQTIGMSLPLKFTNASVKRIHFTFLLHEFRSRFSNSKHVISVTIKKRFCNIYMVRESEERFVAPQNLLML